ncbi:MAG: hypothetical protein WCQ21_06965 [Verrucomicrobiota bacterium]|jgi:hypothetical protein
MKINESARKVLKLRYCSGLLVVLMLVSAEFWMLCRFGRGCGQISTQSPIPAPAISDMFGVR